MPVHTQEIAKNAVHRLPGLCAHCGIGASTAYDFINRGLLPPAVRVGPKLALWPIDEISRIMAARIRGASEDEIRELVSQIMAERKNRT